MRNFKKIISLIMMMVMIFAMLTACSSGSDKGSKENTLSTPQAAMYEYASAINAKDAKRLVNLNIPKDLAERKNVNIGSVEDEAKILLERVEEMCGKNYKMDIKILDERYVEGEELVEGQEKFKKMFDADLQAICVLEVEMTIKGEKENINDTDPMTFLKYNDRWYISDL